MISKYTGKGKSGQAEKHGGLSGESDGMSSRGLWDLIYGQVEANRKKADSAKKRVAIVREKAAIVKMPYRVYILKIAAVFIIVTGLTVVFRYEAYQKVPEHFQRISSEYFTKTLIMDDGSREVVDSVGHSTPHELALPDGSRVTLFYGSSLRFAESFGHNTREIFLNGRAIFDVGKNLRPFILHCSTTTVMVLGTSFSIAGYDDEPTSEITLFKGAVQVIHGSYRQILHPAQQAIVRNDSIAVREASNLGYFGRWSVSRSDPFIFDDTDLETAVKRIARWYNLKVVKSNNVRGVAITGTFSQNIPIDNILERIRLAESDLVRLERRNDTILITNPKKRT
jgi:hypothetical protein